MKKLHIHIFYLLFTALLFGGCQNVKDGLTGKKKSNSDEFLIEKKNPLVLPPEFEKLPRPKTLTKKEEIEENETDLEAILTKKKTKTNSNSTSTDTSSDKSLEKTILEKIKNN